MTDKPKLIIHEEITFFVGNETFLDSSTVNGNAVVFEDNGETGYFYAIDNQNEMKILDALHIYNVSIVIDKDKESLIKILWSEDETKAFLSINDYYHAVFDFESKGGYCRNGFPESNNNWTKDMNRILTDELLIKLAKL